MRIIGISLKHLMASSAVFLLISSGCVFDTGIDPLDASSGKAVVETDWLVEPVAVKASVRRMDNSNEIVLGNGLIRRTFRLSPNGATVGFDNLITGQSIIRGVKPEAIVRIDGVRYEVGGLKGQPNYAFLQPDWIDQLKTDPKAMQFTGFEVGKPKERMAWNRVRHHAPDAQWPPAGVYLRMDYAMPQITAETLAGDLVRLRVLNFAAYGEIDENALAKLRQEQKQKRQIRVSVHYELYDGLPMLSKWITVHNDTDRAVRLDSFTSEILAAVEYGSAVEDRALKFTPPNIHVETDYAFSGMTATNTSRFSVHWVDDPDYATQVNYLRHNPCQLEVRPSMGPAEKIDAGKAFESFRAFILPLDSYDRERNGLAQRRMYRTIAPWVTENPLMMHVRYSDWKTVKNAIDQCTEVGFEMVILTFWSGFNIEDDSAAYIEKMKGYADYAHSKGIEIGGYSLLASRRVGGGNDVVMPTGQKPTFGNSPCLHSKWGEDYFRKLYQFYEKTGFTLLEHDGSYPGDVCASTEHPGHENLADSRWKQWKKISDFYKWCRGRGVYLNVPDYYYLAGSTKCGMGYRETNWSLPRAQQVIHTRQNIFDGTWQKLPSMGWMFVPLTQYHGGGAAATIEPLNEHLDHYESMINSNLGAGVQACYRGPRLFDTEETKQLVKKWVDWYKKHRQILEGDVIHLRRADGRDIDYWLNVDPGGEEKGLLMVYNPLAHEVVKTIDVPLYYTGLKTIARVSEKDGKPRRYGLDRDYTIRLTVKVGAQDTNWFVIK